MKAGTVMTRNNIRNYLAIVALLTVVFVALVFGVSTALAAPPDEIPDDAVTLTFVMPQTIDEDPNIVPFEDLFPQFEGWTSCGWNQIDHVKPDAFDHILHPSDPDSPGGVKLIPGELAGHLYGWEIVLDTSGCVTVDVCAQHFTSGPHLLPGEYELYDWPNPKITGTTAVAMLYCGPTITTTPETTTTWPATTSTSTAPTTTTPSTSTKTVSPTSHVTTTLAPDSTTSTSTTTTSLPPSSVPSTNVPATSSVPASVPLSTVPEPTSTPPPGPSTTGPDYPPTSDPTLPTVTITTDLELPATGTTNVIVYWALVLIFAGTGSALIARRH